MRRGPTVAVWRAGALFMQPAVSHITLLHFFDLTTPLILTFTAVLIRVAFMFLFLPVWGEMMTPAKVQILAIVAIAMALTPVVRIDFNAYPASLGQMIYAIAVEAALGFSVAFLVRLVFAAVQIAGQMAGEQIGFAIANVLSPDQSSQITVVAQIKYAFALLLFFTLNFHLVVFRAMAESFEIAPAFHVQMGANVFALTDAMATAMFSMSVKMAAPILATMLFVNVALGLINKASPQVNVFLESFPIRIILGLFIFSMVVRALSRLLSGYYVQLDHALQAMLQAWRA